MIGDLRAVIAKELRELLRQRGSVRGTLLSVLIPIAMLGIFLPWQTGQNWLTSPLSLAFWAVIPVLLVSAIIADSFAGERERHTLETLLATRLSDRAILFGKLLAAIGYTFALTLLIPLLGFLTVNVSHWQGRLAFYPIGMLLAGLLLSLAVASVMATAGVIASLRAATVRQAQQTLSFAVLFLTVVPSIGLQVMPRLWREELARAVAGSGFEGILLVSALCLMLLEGALLVAAMARFRRAKLILD